MQDPRFWVLVTIGAALITGWLLYCAFDRNDVDEIEHRRGVDTWGDAR